MPDGIRDLDRDYATYDNGLQEFEAVSVAEGRKLLFEHCKAVVQDAEAKQSTVRDKAKVILGSTAFFLTLLSAAVTLVHNWYSTVPFWATAVTLLVLVWVASHFLRALILSIRAITRDESVVASTQEITQSLSGTDAEYTSGRVYQRLAARLRSAATATNQLILQRVNLVILAQTSFRWGLRLIPILFILYVAVIIAFAGRFSRNADAIQQLNVDVSREMRDSEQRVHAEMQTIRQDIAAIRDQNQVILQSLASQRAEIIAKITELMTALRQLKDQGEVHHESLSDQLETLRSDGSDAAKQLDGKIVALTQKVDDLLVFLQALEKQVAKETRETNENHSNEEERKTKAQPSLP